VSPSVTVPTAAGIFSPLRPTLGLDSHGYSPTLFQQIIEADATLKSSLQASLALNLLQGLKISPRHVNRLAHEIGTELAHQRDANTQQHRRRQLDPQVANAPPLAVTEVDGARVFTRESGCGPGVHQAQAKEDKIACLLSMERTTHAEDPQPQPPAAFRDTRRVVRLVQRLHGVPAGLLGAQQDDQQEPDEPAEQSEATATEPWRGAPRKRVRTCVATMQDSAAFGPMVAAEAQRRRFYEAIKQVFLGDGQQYNWAIQCGYFPHATGITDFIHVICYLFLAGWAVGQDEAEGWAFYERWLEKAWQGKVADVIEEMTIAQERLGLPPPGEEIDENDPRQLLASALTYLKNNASRMDYARYRQEGLPVTSSLVESLVGEFNARVKGKDKHWNRPEGCESILQLRAAVLSQDDRLTRFFANRAGCPYRRRPETV
jgi:hypothetical protein